MSHTGQLRHKPEKRTTFASGILEVFVVRRFPSALLSLDIACVSLSAARPTMPFCEKEISTMAMHSLQSSSALFHDLHPGCCGDAKVRRVGRGWFHPLLSVYWKASFIFHNDAYTVVALQMQAVHKWRFVWKTERTTSEHFSSNSMYEYIDVPPSKHAADTAGRKGETVAII